MTGYPKKLDGSTDMPASLRSYFETHDMDLLHRPSLACVKSASIWGAIGCSFSVARGIAIAGIDPSIRYPLPFIRTIVAICPVYIVPFVLGSQVDCISAAIERRMNKRAEPWSPSVDF